MKISAQIVADSINPLGTRITSVVLRYPLMIHNEVMTHRAFSRNAASSRAIPLKVMLKTVEDDYAGPVFWAENQSGMQAVRELEDDDRALAMQQWRKASEDACIYASRLGNVGVHKQIANRTLMPYLWMTTLVTATDWQNAASLRAHPDAQQEFQALMYCFLNEYLSHDPLPLAWGKWHMPFMCEKDNEMSIELKLKIATARACWVSYNKHDKTEFDIKDAIERHDSCMDSGHWSPFEHCAKSQSHAHRAEYSNFDFGGEFSGWLQYRKMFPHERRTMTHLEMMDRLDQRPDWIKLDRNEQGTFLSR